ncbi:MAG: hypothetical protein R6V06_02435 [Kiritimatiellia bacterium]
MKKYHSIAVTIVFLTGFCHAENLINQKKSTLDADGKTAWYSGKVLPIEGKAFSDT